MLDQDEPLADSCPQEQQRGRTLLLVDDEENILSSLRRLLRKEGYDILSAGSGMEGLKILKSRPVDVIISDQRMPGMTGVEFLRQAKELYPGTIRIVLSGYTELQAVTGAINEGAIYKFLTKPWDDELLRGHIAEAFRQKELADENRRLHNEVQRANAELEVSNQKLQALLQERERRINLDETTLGVLYEILDLMPWPILGVDLEGNIVIANSHADHLFQDQGGLLGQSLDSVLPASAAAALMSSREPVRLELSGQAYRARSRNIGLTSAGRGLTITLEAESTS